MSIDPSSMTLFVGHFINDRSCSIPHCFAAVNILIQFVNGSIVIDELLMFCEILFNIIYRRTSMDLDYFLTYIWV